MYINPETYVPSWPGQNVIKCIQKGANRSKLRKNIERGVMESKAYFDLDYDGPKKLDAMWKDGRFCDVRNVNGNPGAAKKSVVQRARPIFNSWSLEIGLLVDVREISLADLLKCIEDAGLFVGLSDYRPRFGRFTVEQF